MSDFFTKSALMTANGTISTFGEGCMLAETTKTISASISATAAVFPAALRAIYTPVILQRPYLVTKAAWLNGTVIAGNVDVAIYSDTGTRLVASGSTAMAGSGLVQIVELTDTVVGPGVVFLAMVTDSATATFNANSTVGAALERACGVQQEVLGALPLPATWTPANPAAAYVPTLVFTYENTVI